MTPAEEMPAAPQQEEFPRTLLAVLCLATLAACGDGEAEPRYPEPDAREYEGDVEPCDVVVSPEPGSEPVAYADVPRPVWLPNIVAGSSREYVQAIAGTTASEIVSGEIPPGMTLDTGVLRGPASSTGATSPMDYRFSMAPADDAASWLVDVAITVYPAGQGTANVATDYWEPGPYVPWSTQPMEMCSSNPTIPMVGDVPDVPVYLTYPLLEDPTVSGETTIPTGPFPVIVFAHANNDTQCDINERYLSLHDHWASWGYIVAAVDGTSLNCQSGTRENIQLRSQGQLLALALLDALNADPSGLFHGRFDLSRIVMAGHSRGGGASLVSAWEDPRVTAIIDLQGIDATAFGFGSAPVARVPLLGMTAGEDVDLNYPIVEPTEDQLSGPYTWVNINGGIHAHTADTVPIEPDDVPLITQQQQHDIDELYTTAFLARFIGVGDGSPSPSFVPDMAAEAVLYSHLGVDEVVAEISERGVFARWNRRAHRVWIDSFDSPLRRDSTVNELGGDHELVGFDSAGPVPTYQPAELNPPAVYDKPWSMRLSASRGGGVWTTWLTGDRAPVDVGPSPVLMARVKGPDAGTSAPFSVRVETASGTFEADGGDIVGPLPMENRFTQLVFPIPDPASSVQITAISIVFDGPGTIFVDDLRIE